MPEEKEKPPVNARVGADVKLVINLGDYNSAHIGLSVYRDVPEGIDYKSAMRALRKEVEAEVEVWTDEMAAERKGK